MVLRRSLPELLTAVRFCTTKEEARKLVRQEVASIIAENESLMEDYAKQMVLHSIGYMTANVDSWDERRRILELFETKHPYFGTVDEWPKTEEGIAKLSLAYATRAKAMREERNV